MIARGVLTAFACVVLPAALAAQTDPRAQLESRGLPPDLVAQVVRIAADATAQGLPAGPIVDKAIEGFAKHAPATRITTALEQFSARMLDGRAAVRRAGVAEPSGELVTAAAEALARGIASAQVGTVVHASAAPTLAAPGLTVVAALAAQGMRADEAVAVVTDAMRRGRTASQILDLPSVARAIQARGLSPDETGQSMLHGDGEGPRLGGYEHRGPDVGGRAPQTPGGPPPPRPPDGGRHGGPGPRPGSDGGGQLSGHP